MTIRRILFWCRLTAGCLAGIVIFAMSITGVLLAFLRQINTWADRGFRIEPGRQTLPLELVAYRLGADAKQPLTINLRVAETAPVELAYGRERTLYVDPASGKVLGEASRATRNFFVSVERIHRSLGSELRSGLGRPITGACNLLFLFLVVSGFCLWLPKKWLRQYVRPAIWFRGGLRGRARDWNWHNTIGFWSAIPLFFIVLSGVIMSYGWANNLLYRVTGIEVPRPPQREGSAELPARRSQGQRPARSWCGRVALLRYGAWPLEWHELPERRLLPLLLTTRSRYKAPVQGCQLYVRSVSLRIQRLKATFRLETERESLVSVI